MESFTGGFFCLCIYLPAKTFPVFFVCCSLNAVEFRSLIPRISNKLCSFQKVESVIVGFAARFIDKGKAWPESASAESHTPFCVSELDLLLLEGESPRRGSAEAPSGPLQHKVEVSGRRRISLLSIFSFVVFGRK